MLSADIVEIHVWNRGKKNGNVVFSLDDVILEEIKDLLEPPACVISLWRLKTEKYSLVAQSGPEQNLAVKYSATLVHGEGVSESCTFCPHG